MTSKIISSPTDRLPLTEVKLFLRKFLSCYAVLPASITSGFIESVELYSVLLLCSRFKWIFKMSVFTRGLMLSSPSLVPSSFVWLS